MENGNVKAEITEGQWAKNAPWFKPPDNSFLLKETEAVWVGEHELKDTICFSHVKDRIPLPLDTMA